MTTPPPTPWRDYVEEVRRRAPIRAILSRDLPEAATGARQVRCPYHQDDTPSMSVNDAGGYWHCFGCRVGGDVFRWVERRQGLIFAEAVEYVAALVGLPPYHAADSREDLSLDQRLLDRATDLYQANLSPAARAWALERGLTPDQIEAIRLGEGGILPEQLFDWLDVDAASEVAVRLGILAPVRNAITWAAGPVLRDRMVGRVVLPLLRHGRPAFLSGRAFAPAVHPKYLHTRGTAPLYGEDRLRDSSGPVFVTEGPFDALALERWGCPAVALLGTERISPLLFTTDRPLYLVLDGDAAGQRATVELAARLGPARVRVITLPSGEDPGSWAGRDDHRAEWDGLFATAPQAILWAIQRLPRKFPEAAVAPEWAQALRDLSQLLGALDPVTAEVYLQHVIPEHLRLGKAAGKTLRATMLEAVARSRLHCPACGTVLRP